jgi:Na+/H+-dicarboxylate symporter
MADTEIKVFGKSLTTLILIALATGVIAGLAIKALDPGAAAQGWLVDGVLKAGGQIFLAALRLLVVPVVFVSLVCGVGSLDDIRKMGRIGSKTLGFYLFTTALAIALALGFASLTRPGAGFQLTTTAEYTAKEAPGVTDTLIGFVPTNAIQAMAEANMIQIIVLALLFGLAISMAGASGKRLYSWFLDLNEVIMRLVTIVMMIAPIGVFCLIAMVFAKQGFEAIAPLSKYFFTVLAVLLLHLFLVYGSILKLIGRLNPLTFFRKFKDVLVFAFSTSSSNATLPATLEAVEHRLGVKNSVASFTLPLGATVNMDGTAIMQGVATVFISQAYGIDIGWEGYLAVIGTATVASIGTAGVPGVGLITLAMVLRQVNLPVEGIGLIIGVDRLLDMTRTAVNVTGDAAITCVVARSENQMDQGVFNAIET